MSEWIKTDDYQWQRKVGDTYEMYQIEYVDYLKERPYIAGGGTFKMSDFYQYDIDYVIDAYGYETMENFVNEYGDDSEMVLAECLFECNWGIWDLESFDTLEEAETFVNKLMTGEDFFPKPKVELSVMDGMYSIAFDNERIRCFDRHMSDDECERIGRLALEIIHEELSGVLLKAYANKSKEA